MTQLLMMGWAQAETVHAKAEKFFSWLQKNEKSFVDCPLKKTNQHIRLCDGTKVSYPELKILFLKNKIEIIDWLRQKKIQVELICDPKSTADEVESSHCSQESTNSTFKNVTGLHGLYLPDENKILARSTATVGTLIHEYIHALQSNSKEKIDGHIYKSEKNKLRREIEAELDRRLIEIKQLELKKDKVELNQKAVEFIKLNDYMMAFSPWQDLIDERSLFLLYIKYSKDFNIPQSDIDLALKNMKFICNRKELKDKLPSAECSEIN
jgi:hypothetical protein